MVEVTLRTVGRRSLIASPPTARLQERMVGMIGRSMLLYPVRLHAFVFAADHARLLLTASGADQLRNFLRHLHHHATLVVQQAAGWRGSVWSARVAIVPVTDARGGVNRFVDLLSFGVRTDATAPALLSSAGYWLSGDKLTGTWVDGTQAHEHSKRRGFVDERDYTITYDISLSPLPTWTTVIASGVAGTVRSIAGERAVDFSHGARDDAEDPTLHFARGVLSGVQRPERRVPLRRRMTIALQRWWRTLTSRLREPRLLDGVVEQPLAWSRELDELHRATPGCVVWMDLHVGAA